MTTVEGISADLYRSCFVVRLNILAWHWLLRSWLGDVFAPEIRCSNPDRFQVDLKGKRSGSIEPLRDKIGYDFRNQIFLSRTLLSLDTCSVLKSQIRSNQTRCVIPFILLLEEFSSSSFSYLFWSKLEQQNESIHKFKKLLKVFHHQKHEDDLKIFSFAESAVIFKSKTCLL